MRLDWLLEKCQQICGHALLFILGSILLPFLAQRESTQLCFRFLVEVIEGLAGN